jgi:integrase
MAKTYQLTWVAGEKRWRKKYKGKQYAFPFGQNKGDRQGYEQALKAWHTLKARLDAGAAEREAIAYRRLDEELGRLYPDVYTTESDRQWFRNTSRKTTEGKTVGESLAVFDRTFEIKGEAGQLAMSNVQVLPIHSATIGKMIGLEKAVAEIDGQTFLKLHSDLMTEVAEKKRAPRSARTLMGHFKRFVRWLAATNAIPALPSILLMPNNRDLSFKVIKKEILTYEVAEVERLLNAASERTRLYIQLALNCGMTQVDISDLAPKEVNWKAGTITRKRSKEKDEENVPVVCWRLWPSTLKLLKQERAKSGDRVLTNEVGGPLRSWEDGKNKDNVRSAYERLNRKLKIKEPKGKRRTFKSLRKTAATVLGSDSEHGYGRYAQYFLGHAPDNTADSFYVKPTQRQFDAALAWLGEQFIRNI